MTKRYAQTTLLVVIAAGLTGCASPYYSSYNTSRGAVSGSVLGGTAGGIIGHQKGRGLEGAAIGGGIGALLGGLLGSSYDRPYAPGYRGHGHLEAAHGYGRHERSHRPYARHIDPACAPRHYH